MTSTEPVGSAMPGTADLDASADPLTRAISALRARGIPSDVVGGAVESSEERPRPAKLVVEAQDRAAARAALQDTELVLLKPRRGALDEAVDHFLGLDESTSAVIAVELHETPESGAGRPPGRSAGQLRLARGGALIAVVGGDGSGKTTLVSRLSTWLAGDLPTRVLHLGKPPRGVLSLAVKTAISVVRRLRPSGRPAMGHYPDVEEHGGVFPGWAWLLWQVLTARDRRRQYRRVRTLAGQGFVVICDRFPLSELRLMDGSRTGWLDDVTLPRGARPLMAYERRCYLSLPEPDAIVVLRVAPDVAAARKDGVDPPEYVRRRSAEVYDHDWSGSSVELVDAGASADEVLSLVQRTVWQALCSPSMKR